AAQRRMRHDVRSGGMRCGLCALCRLLKVGVRQMADNKAANQLWGGRFSGGPSAVMTEINASIGFDKRLWRQDIAGSKAHAAMAAAQGILSAEDNAAIQAGLDQVAAEIEAGKLVENPALEDIHMHVEARLAELIGEPAKRLHV